MSSEPVFAVRSGPWSPDAIADFLDRSAIPIRLASAGKHFPMEQSLWFLHERGALWCCTQDDSVLAQRLRADAVSETDRRDTYQAIAPQTEAGLFLVPKVIE